MLVRRGAACGTLGIRTRACQSCWYTPVPAVSAKQAHGQSMHTHAHTHTPRQRLSRTIAALRLRIAESSTDDLAHLLLLRQRCKLGSGLQPGLPSSAGPHAAEASPGTKASAALEAVSSFRLQSSEEGGQLCAVAWPEMAECDRVLQSIIHLCTRQGSGFLLGEGVLCW